MTVYRFDSKYIVTREDERWNAQWFWLWSHVSFSRAAKLSHVLIIWDALCSTYRSTSTRVYIYFRYPGSVLKLWRKYSSGTEGNMMYMYSRAVLVKLMRHKIYGSSSVSRMYRSKVDLELWLIRHVLVGIPSIHTLAQYIVKIYWQYPPSSEPKLYNCNLDVLLGMPMC